jgi:ferredoxin
MAYVIAEPCVGTKDNSCTEVCPVDCIHPTPDEPDYDTVEQLYIDPEECIDCDACVEACPVDAIFAEDQIPDEWTSFVDKNIKYCAPPERVRAPAAPAPGRPGQHAPSRGVSSTRAPEPRGAVRRGEARPASARRRTCRPALRPPRRPEAGRSVTSSRPPMPRRGLPRRDPGSRSRANFGRFCETSRPG